MQQGYAKARDDHQMFHKTLAKAFDETETLKQVPTHATNGYKAP